MVPADENLASKVELLVSTDKAMDTKCILNKNYIWEKSSVRFLFVVSVVHFTPYLTGLSSMMLIWSAGARFKWRAHLHKKGLRYNEPPSKSIYNCIINTIINKYWY